LGPGETGIFANIIEPGKMWAICGRCGGREKKKEFHGWDPDGPPRGIGAFLTSAFFFGPL